MRLLLNILWFIFGGWISGSLWILAGVILAITIVGLPWTPGAFRIAGFSYWPFGKVVVDRDPGRVQPAAEHPVAGAGRWWLALQHILLAAALAVTIIGIPFAWQHVKLAMLSLTPVGKGVIEV